MTRKSKIVNKAMKKSIEEKLLLINTIKGKLLSDEKQNELKSIEKEEEEEELKCANGCGMTCNLNDYVHGYCSRSCFMEVYKIFSDDF